MKTTYALLSAAVGALAQSTDAEVVADNPPGARYIARFDGGLFLSGRVLAGSDAFGLGITYHVSLSGLPEENGPFNYHIHEDPVPEDGDCEGTGGHLDPYGRTDEPPCDDDSPETCEVGDLSGKHGALEGSSADQSLHDLYTSLNPDDASFIGNRSVVIHAADGSRIACANLEEVAPEDPIDPPTETDPDDGPSETAPEETPSETAPEETPSETASEESPSETAPVESSPAEESPSETAAPDEDEDDECEAEEPEVPSPTQQAPSESSTEEAPAETSAEEPPAETTAEEPPAETTAEEAPRPTVEAPAES